MLHAPEESADFTKISGALSINMGTLGREPVQGMKNAIEAANEKGIPWVLDPVGMGATPYRSQCTKEIAEMKPTAIRGNASEIMALCAAIVGTTGVAGKVTICDQYRDHLSYFQLKSH